MDISAEIQKYRQEIKSERMDMSFGEIINMYRDKEIIISPEYQRAFRWDEQRQSDFIESILFLFRLFLWLQIQMENGN